MGILRDLRGVTAPTVNTGVWAVLFLDDRTGLGLLVVPVLMVAVAVTLHRPLAGCLLLGAAHGTALAVGTEYGGLELLVGTMVVLGWAGRYGRSVAPGLLGIALAAVLSACRDGFELRKLLVTTLVYGCAWAFGRLVRRRAHAAVAAVAEAERLAGTDLREVAQPRAVAERRRIADRAAVDLRSAVHTMLREIDAILAGGALRQDDLRRIRERGARTVEELRRLLVLLRAEPPPTPVASPKHRPSRFHADLAIAVVTATAAGAALWFIDGWASGGWLGLSYAGLVVALALRSTAPLVAGLVLSAAMLPVAAHPPADPDALLPLAGGLAVVIWRLVEQPGRRTTAVSVVLTVSALAVATRFGLDGLAFIGVVVMVSMAAGLAWGEPDRILIRARERSGALREQMAAATAEAVRQERLRIARDLHDSTSHAVGVMLMQVSAAEAQVTTAPEQAMRSLVTAREAGERARQASDPLLPGLTEPTPGDADSLTAELQALVAQWQATGMAITATIEPPPLLNPHVAVTCYRIVQEALTNCARHAPGARVRVRVVSTRRHLIVEVEDTGATRPVSSTPSGGWGLSGLQERVQFGSFSAGPYGRGFRVTAQLSLISAPRSTS